VGVVVVPGAGYEGIVGETTTPDCVPYWSGTSEAIVEPQQSPLLLLRLNTRAEARLKNPVGLNSPQQPPEGPDWQPA
jgi:hypothetical protein